MTVRTLLIMRHAKSSWELETSDDLRPLSDRGHRDGLAAGEWLVGQALAPDLVLCSPALRALQTWEELSAAGVTARELRAEDWIYEGFAAGMLQGLRQLDPAATTVLVIGHAPVLQDLVRGLGRREATDAWYRLDEKFPTSAIAVLEFEGPWSGLAPGAARLVQYAVPRGCINSGRSPTCKAPGRGCRDSRPAAA